MCVAGDDKDSCIGDSGGPLIRKGSGIDRDTLVGLVSWGRECAEDGVPGVYSRISYFYDWIVETVCEEFEDDAPPYMECESSSSDDSEEDSEEEEESSEDDDWYPVQDRTTAAPTKSPTP